jgi:prepilin-type N-terminal cleavage/methylation domain-containing protein
VTARRGVTLLELLVALAVLSMLFGLSSVAVGSLSAPPTAARVRQLAAARASAIRSGVPVSVIVDSEVYRFLPDGRGSGRGVDPLTGAPDASR